MTRRTRLSILLLVTWIYYGEAAAPLQDGGGPAGLLLRVYDARNRFVGNVIGTGGNGNAAHVAYRLNGILFTIGVWTTFITGNGTGPLFTSENCAGTPYMQSLGTLFAGSGVNGTTLYVEDTNVPVQTIVFVSELSRTGCSRTTPTSSAARPALVFANFLNQFQPPFSAR
jgi:hypothetical protein